jgi:hypothetical protein
VSISTKYRIAILTGSIAVITALILYNFANFLQGIGAGDPFALALLISFFGLSFVVLDKLGFVFGYRDEIQSTDSGKSSIVQES